MDWNTVLTTASTAAVAAVVAWLVSLLQRSREDRRDWRDLRHQAYVRLVKQAHYATRCAQLFSSEAFGSPVEEFFDYQGQVRNLETLRDEVVLMASGTPLLILDELVQTHSALETSVEDWRETNNTDQSNNAAAHLGAIINLEKQLVDALRKQLGLEKNRCLIVTNKKRRYFIPLRR